MAGAAQATAISQMVSFIILLLPYLRKRTITRISIRFFKLVGDGKGAGAKGIPVNTVLTGHIEGDVPEEDILPPDMKQHDLDITPLGRLGKPEDIAGIVNFLASEESSFITGQVIAVNGGSLLGQ